MSRLTGGRARRFLAYLDPRFYGTYSETEVIQQEYADLSIRRGQTFALKPGVTKEDIKQEAADLYQAAKEEAMEQLSSHTDMDEI